MMNYMIMETVQKENFSYLLDVTASPLFISLKRAERSKELSMEGATSPTGNTGGGGGRPGGGGGAAAVP
jgi:uncharacterized membrane protein